MRARGRKPRSEWLRRSERHRHARRGADACVRARARRCFVSIACAYADDAPMALEYATVVADCLPSLDAVETSLYEALERAGNRPVRALQRLRAVLLTREQAELLRAQPRRCGSAGRARRFPAGRARDRVLAVVLSRRYLRLRRRAQHAVMSRYAACSGEAAARSELRCARSCTANRDARRRGSASVAAKHGAARRRHLRAR